MGSHEGHSHALPSGIAQRRALWIALVANGGFMVVEIFGGVAFHSLALLADALHMGSDVIGLGVALVAQSLMTRPTSTRHTYGWLRAEVLGAQANGIILLATSVWVFYEAYQRIGTPEAVNGVGLLVVAVIGLGVNLGSAVLLNRARGRSLNMRGAFLHMAVDAAGSVGAIIAGLAVIVAGADWVDPVVSILIGLLVLWSAWSLLRDTTGVLLESTPKGIDPIALQAAIASSEGVAGVHHLHVWNISSETTALSGHVVLRDDPPLHQAQARAETLKDHLAREFGIEHATLELECHDCSARRPVALTTKRDDHRH